MRRCPSSTIVQPASSPGGEEAGDLVDWCLRGGEAEAQQRLRGDAGQALERQREVRTAPCADHRMDLVDDHRPDRAQHVPAALRRQEQVQRLGCGGENVRRRSDHGRPFRRRRVTGADRGGDPGRGKPGGFGERLDCESGLGQVLVDVGAQRLERRHIEHPDLVGQRTAKALLEQIVDRRQEGRQRLAGTGGRGDERVPSGARSIPSRGAARRLVPPARLQTTREPGG